MAPEVPQTDTQQSWRELLSQAQPAEWVREMIENYRRTGTYRAEDLRRLLGDPTKGVEVGPNQSLSNLFTNQPHQAP